MSENSTATVSFSIRTDRLRRMHILMAKGGVTTWEDLFNNSLMLLERAMNQCEQGWRPALVREASQEYQEIEIPMVRYAAMMGRSNEEVEDLLKLQSSGGNTAA